jgi:hypothetical protein
MPVIPSRLPKPNMSLDFATYPGGWGISGLPRIIALGRWTIVWLTTEATNYFNLNIFV